ncbi:uncharacterized protein RCC_05473 [Ramularia collo-cygni]|uniref:Uncharacterized protein n=1 Tax=Ramularia collo-cygni TaxID=112498 RepID=A0A2D3URA3_9PEZI|nr:uncharacterized protein RCC_05473 [Ramularia collo-cygni]CZT19622.1 uncharacterized protein RCC_05473 [Ramularia collo-cygni]
MSPGLSDVQITFIVIVCVLGLAAAAVRSLGLAITRISQDVAQTYKKAWNKGNGRNSEQNEGHSLDEMEAPAGLVAPDFEHASQVEAGMVRTGSGISLEFAAEFKPPSIPPPAYERDPPSWVPRAVDEFDWAYGVGGDRLASRSRG